jgi:glycine cleavage system H lipoate-binding protein
VLIAGLYRVGQNRTKKKGKLTNYGVVAGKIESVKNADYSDVIMHLSGVFYSKTQLIDALIAL